MRLRNLFEYDNVDAAKKEIIATVSGLSAENEQDAQLLDKIYQVLNSDGMRGKIAAAFNATTENENLNITPLLQKITQLIFHIDSDYKNISKFLDRLQKGNVVNTAVFQNVGVGSVRDFFGGDETATRIFQALAEVGAGKKQKGPGEYALAMMSDKIALRMAEGDLDIEGAGRVEVKAETTKGGGRLGEGGPSNMVAKEYWSVLPSIANHFEQGNKGLGITKFVPLLAADLPLNDMNKKKQRQDMLTKWYGQIFSDPTGFVDAFMQDDVVTAEKMYGKANFELYKANYGWDTLLSVNFPNLKYAVCKTGDDFVALKEAKHFQSFSISVVPSSARPSEVFCQLSLSQAKV